MRVELTFGERLKDARKCYNKNGDQTLGEVQAATGVRSSLISDLENDKARGTSYRVIGTLARHYGVSLDWLVEGGVHPVSREVDIHTACKTTGLSEAAVKMLQRLDKLSPSQGGTPHIPSILSECLETKGFLQLLTASNAYAHTVVPENAAALSNLDLTKKYKCVEEIDRGVRDATEGVFVLATAYDIAEANHAKAIGGLESMLSKLKTKKEKKENPLQKDK